MKIIPIIGCCALCVFFVNKVSAQSSFEFFTLNPPEGVDAPVFDALGGPVDGPNYLGELYGGATSNSLTPLLNVLGHYSRVIISPTYGYFFSSTGGLSVISVQPHGWAWLQLRVWDARLGATYEETVARAMGGYGASPLFYAQGHDPTLVLPEFPAPLIGLQSFSLLPVIPEPSTCALLALGSLLLVWRLRSRLTSPTL